MIDIIAKTCLLFGNSFFLLSLLLIGFIWFDRKIFMHAAYLLAFCILVNVALKVSFQIPLPAHINKHWFAFPSGHMQSSTVFYGWLAYNIVKPLFRLAMLMVLLGIGASLIYFGYHNYWDVIAGIFFGLLLILFYRYLIKNWAAKTPWILLLLSSFLMPYVDWQYSQIPAHAWIAYFALLAFTFFCRGQKI